MLTVDALTGVAVVPATSHVTVSDAPAAQDAEARILVEMESRLGGAISGNFPLLVYLAYTSNLARQIRDGVTNWPEQLQANAFFHPLLLQILPLHPGSGCDA
jgi:hypothetical protein